MKNGECCEETNGNAGCHIQRNQSALLPLTDTIDMYSHNFEEVLDLKKQAAEVSVLPTEMTMSCLSKNLHEGVRKIYHDLSSISQESFEIKTLPADFLHIR